MSSTVRIDTVRNQMRGTRTLIDDGLAELDDLHALGWERTRNTTDDPQRPGGTRDYALDTHGNPTARAALDVLKAAFAKAANDLADALDQASYVLRQGDDQAGNTSRTLVTHAEHAETLAARARRVGRGDHTSSHRRIPQPGLDKAVKAAQQRAEKAEAKVKRLQRRLDRAEAQLAAADRRLAPELDHAAADARWLERHRRTS